MPLIYAEPDALARIYARSLLDMVKSGSGGNGTGANAVESTLGELEDLLELARQDRNFGEFLSSMILPASKRKASLEKILKGRVSDLTSRFLQVLNDKDRLNHLPAIVGAFAQLVQESYGRVEVDVYTATPIDQSELGAIKARLQERLGREPVLHAYTEPSMLGGVKMQIGDQLIDASVETQLRKIRDRLNGEGASAIRTQAAKLIG